MNKQNSFSPPQAVRDAASRGLKLRQKWNRGGLDTNEAGEQGIGSGVARARDLAAGRAIPLETINRMKSFFGRHRQNYQPDKKMPDGGPTAGTIAYLLWGGEPGSRWVDSILRRETMDKTLKVNGQPVALADMARAWVEKQERKELQQQQQARSRRYGISPKEGGRLTPPADFPTAEAEYGDPVNYRYPADAGHARPALSYFNQDGQREAGGYSSTEWAVIGQRLARLISQHLKAGYQYKNGKLAQRTEKGEVEKQVDIIAKDDDRRLAYGIILRPEEAVKGPEDRDLQGDSYTALEVEKAAHGYMARSAGATDWQHIEIIPREGAVLVESVVMGCDVAEWHGQPVSLRKGDWLGVVWVPADELWNEVKKGTVRAFSIRGKGKRTPVVE